MRPETKQTLQNLETNSAALTGGKAEPKEEGEGEEEQQHDLEPSNPFLKPFEDFFYEVAADPITGEVMTDPIITPDGYCYERAALMAYLRTHNNLTPRGVLIPTNSEQRKNYLIPNTKLARAIREVTDARKEPLSHEALIQLYTTFSQNLAYDVVRFEWMPDPAVVGIENIETHMIRGGVIGIDGRKDAPLLDTSNNVANEIGDQDRFLPFPIAYVRLREALNTLQGKIQRLDMGSFPRFDECYLPEFIDEYKHKSNIVGGAPIRPDVVAAAPRDWWWTLGHLHEAWWYWSGMTRHPVDCAFSYLFKAPITLTAGLLFTPISAVARYLNPTQCDPDLNPDVAKRKAGVELAALTTAMTAQLPFLLVQDAGSYFYYPAIQLISELTSLASLTAVIPAPVITGILVTVYALLVATVATAFFMYAIHKEEQPAVDVQEPIPVTDRPLSIPVFESQVPNAPTQAPYLLWRKERDAVVEPIHEPIKLRSPLISPV